MFSTGNEALLDDIYNCLFETDYDLYFDDSKFTSNNPLVHDPPLLDEVWLSEPEQ